MCAKLACGFARRTLDRKIPLGKTARAAYCRPAYAKHGHTSIRSFRRVARRRNHAGAAHRVVSHHVRLGDGRQLLMYAALPPLDLWPLAWIAPVPWLMLDPPHGLAGRKPYRAIWLAGFVFWMGVLHWLRLPYLGDEHRLGGAVVLFGFLHPAVRRT